MIDEIRLQKTGLMKLLFQVRFRNSSRVTHLIPSTSASKRDLSSTTTYFGYTRKQYDNFMSVSFISGNISKHIDAEMQRYALLQNRNVHSSSAFSLSTMDSMIQTLAAFLLLAGTAIHGA